MNTEFHGVKTGLEMVGEGIQLKERQSSTREGVN